MDVRFGQLLELWSPILGDGVGVNLVGKKKGFHAGDGKESERKRGRKWMEVGLEWHPLGVGYTNL